MRRRPDEVRRYRDAFTQRDLVRELDELAERALPPLGVLELDGWRLRTARGATTWSNSVWPRTAGQRLPLTRRVEIVERYYATRGLPAAYRVTPTAAPAGLAGHLEERGYRATGWIVVVAGGLDQVAASSPGGLEATLLVSPEPERRWLDVWQTAAGADPGSRAVTERQLDRVRSPSAYAVLDARGEPLAVARGVVEGAWLGVFDLVTRPEHRGRGAARLLLVGLARWAAARGAERAYAQVDARDTAARRLHHDVGLGSAYEFRYLTQPARAVPAQLRRT